jgi:hypothetical protein
VAYSRLHFAAEFAYKQRVINQDEWAASRLDATRRDASKRIGVIDAKGSGQREIVDHITIARNIIDPVSERS